jgi:hypothetical protein
MGVERGVCRQNDVGEYVPLWLVQVQGLRKDHGGECGEETIYLIFME